MEKEMIKAHIVDETEEASVNISAALRIACYMSEDENEEKLHGLEIELKEAQEWIAGSMKYVARLKEQL